MKIETLSDSNLHLINTIDSTFTVDSILNVNLTDNKFSYEIQPITPYEKSYEEDETKYSSFVNGDKRVIFFAFENERLTGQIVVRKNWNAFAYINDIRIDKNFRGKGIGKALVQKVIEWAKENNCIGLQAETQDVNVRACLFYEKLGFTLGGFDIFKYSSFEKSKNEIALEWYLLF